MFIASEVRGFGYLKKLGAGTVNRDAMLNTLQTIRSWRKCSWERSEQLDKVLLPVELDRAIEGNKIARKRRVIKRAGFDQ